MHLPVFRGQPEAEVLEGREEARGAALRSWREEALTTLPESLLSLTCFFWRGPGEILPAFKMGVVPPTLHDISLRPLAAVSIHHHLPKCPTELVQWPWYAQCPGTDPRYHLLGRREERPQSQGPAGKAWGWPRWGLSWDVAPALAPSSLALRFPLQCWLFSINAAMGQSKTLLWSHSLPCSGTLYQICTLGWRWTPSKAARSQPSIPLPLKAPHMLARLKMHEQSRYINSHLLKTDYCKYVRWFPSKATKKKKKRGFHARYFGKYFSQGHRLANKTITRNYSMYHEYFLVCTEQFKVL